MARAALGWSTIDLARKADVGVATVNRFETGQATTIPATLAAIQRALEAAGVEFIPENGGGAGVRLRKELPMLVQEIVRGTNRRSDLTVRYQGTDYEVSLPHELLRDHFGLAGHPLTMKALPEDVQAEVLRAARRAIEGGKQAEGPTIIQIAARHFSRR